MLLVISYTRAFNFFNEVERFFVFATSQSPSLLGTLVTAIQSQNVRLEGGEDKGFAYEEYGGKII